LGHLGLALAEAGCRTLLVEGDMRRPTLSTMVGIGSEGGLSLFLSGHVARPRVQPVIDDMLLVVPAGPPPPNPVALLHSERMRAFIEEMMQSHRFVLLDAPPVLPIADARMLGALSEGVVLVVRAGVTSRKDLRRACAALESGGSHLLGTILNGTRTRPGAAYSAYYKATEER